MTDDIDNDGTTLHESGEVVQPTDARLVTLNAQQQALLHRMLDWHAAVVRFGAESPSAFKHFAACAALAVPQAPLQAEPVPVVASTEGWASVPKEPTEAMISAAARACVPGAAKACYQRMLAAAPNKEPKGVQQCVNCGGTLAPHSLDPEWNGRCECARPLEAA